MTTDRNQQILSAYLAGATVTDLAREHGISRQRVNALVRSQGAPHRRPTMAANRKRVEASRDVQGN